MNPQDWANKTATPKDIAFTALIILMMLGGIIAGFYVALKPVEETPVIETPEIYVPTRDESSDEAHGVEPTIRALARGSGFDENLAIRIATCESTLNPSARNPTSSALGLYQFLTGTWEYIGSPGDREDVVDATTAFLEWYPKHPEWWQECI